MGGPPRPGGVELEVRRVQPYQATKTYRCPGCHGDIPRGQGHYVVVPVEHAVGSPPLALCLLGAAGAARRTRDDPPTPLEGAHRPRVEDIEYQADGRRMVGHLAVDDERPGPGPPCSSPTRAAASTTMPRSRARAAGRRSAMSRSPSTTIGDGQPLPASRSWTALGPLMGDPERTRALGQAGLDICSASPHVDPAASPPSASASAARCRSSSPAAAPTSRPSSASTPVSATARPQDARNITRPRARLHRRRDPIIPPEQRTEFEEEMRAAGVDWRMNLYGGAVHSFTNEIRRPPRYGRSSPTTVRTDERSWRGHARSVRRGARPGRDTGREHRSVTRRSSSRCRAPTSRASCTPCRASSSRPAATSWTASSSATATPDRFFMRVQFAADASAVDAGGAAAGFAAIGRLLRDGLAVHDPAASRSLVLMVRKFGHCLNDLLFRSRTGALPSRSPASCPTTPTSPSSAAAARPPLPPHPRDGRTPRPTPRRGCWSWSRPNTSTWWCWPATCRCCPTTLCKQLAGPDHQHPPLVPARLQGRPPVPPGPRPRREAHRRHRPLRHRRPRRGSDHRAGGRARRPLDRRPTTWSRVGRDVECLALARAVRWHAEHRILLNGHRTVVFR